MTVALPATLKTYVAWRFTQVLPGSFRRAKAALAHHLYPILAPLPPQGRNTPALERSAQHGPYIYFVLDDQERVHYVGKSKEKEVIQRWVRPGVGGPATHYWTHSRSTGGCVFEIARGLETSTSRHYTLRYVPVAEIGDDVLQALGLIDVCLLVDPSLLIEKALQRTCRATWSLR